MPLFIALLVMVAICIYLTEKLTEKCPVCGSRMGYGTYGYDRWDCPNCGHHHR